MHKRTPHNLLIFHITVGHALLPRALNLQQLSLRERANSGTRVLHVTSRATARHSKVAGRIYCVLRKLRRLSRVASLDRLLVDDDVRFSAGLNEKSWLQEKEEPAPAVRCATNSSRHIFAPIVFPGSVFPALIFIIYILSIYVPYDSTCYETSSLDHAIFLVHYRRFTVGK